MQLFSCDRHKGASIVRATLHFRADEIPLHTNEMRHPLCFQNKTNKALPRLYGVLCLQQQQANFICAPNSEVALETVNLFRPCIIELEVRMRSSDPVQPLLACSDQ